MNRPINCLAELEHKTSILYFPDDTAGEYYMRGALCFPILVPKPGARPDESHMDIEGFALVAGQNVKTKVVHIFEQTTFNIIDPIVEGNIIRFPGLARWFNQNWTSYYARKYFWRQDYETAKKYRLDIHRSKHIEPKPTLIEVVTYDNDDMSHLIWQYVKLGRLVFEKYSPIHSALKTLQQGDTKHTIPAIYALQVLLCGLDRNPYHERSST